LWRGLDLAALGVEIDPQQVGNSEYDPKSMIETVTLWLFLWDQELGVKLERETHHNSFLHLLYGGLQSRTHKTIAEFSEQPQGRTQEC